MAEARIVVSRVFEELLKAEKLGKSIVVSKGGSSSSKTYSALEFLIYKCIETPNTSVRVGRQDQATCRLSCFTDLQNILIDQFKIFKPESLNKTTMTYTFDNGSVINFVGYQDSAKARGARVDYTFINECTEVSKEVYDQLVVRTKKMTILDFNPVTQTGYYYDLKNDPNCYYIESTFKDNPALPEKNKQTILSWEPTKENIANQTADAYLWSVYALGQPAKREGVIYPIWGESDFWPDIQGCHFRAYGLDFGFSNDPTALIEIRYHDGKLYCKELLYERELVTQANPDYPDIPSIQSRLEDLGISREAHIYADSANPSDIQALKLCGYNVVAVQKGADSILKGINLVKSHPIIVQTSSMNLKAELNQYIWKKVSGVQTAKPEDKFNHLLDALRYVALMKLKPRVSDHYANKKKRRQKVARGGVSRY